MSPSPARESAVIHGPITSMLTVGGPFRSEFVLSQQALADPRIVPAATRHHRRLTSLRYFQIARACQDSS